MTEFIIQINVPPPQTRRRSKITGEVKRGYGGTSYFTMPIFVWRKTANLQSPLTKPNSTAEI